MHAHQFQTARRELKLLRTRLGRIIGDIRRKIEGNTALEDRFGPLLDLAGTGGDELFGDYYTSYLHLPVLQRWSRRAAWVPRRLHEQVGVEMNRVATRWSGNSQGVRGAVTARVIASVACSVRCASSTPL
jgi:hypothetical protein